MVDNVCKIMNYSGLNYFGGCWGYEDIVDGGKFVFFCFILGDSEIYLVDVQGIGSVYYVFGEGDAALCLEVVVVIVW